MISAIVVDHVVAVFVFVDCAEGVAGKLVLCSSSCVFRCLLFVVVGVIVVALRYLFCVDVVAVVVVCFCCCWLW